jgi:2-dehydropantoate 2-reductase
MKIAVLGAGGVGGYFGARLAASGSDITFIARGKHLEAMRKDGLRVISPLGDITIQNPKVVDSVNLVEEADLVVVAVKLWDTEAAAKSLKTLTDRGAAVVSFQNGVHKDEALAAHLSADSLLGGVSYIASVISEPGVVTHSGTLQKLVFGEYDGRRSQRVEKFLAACVKAGITAEISDNIRRLIWEKYVFLVGLSGTTSSVRKPIGPIRDNPRTRAFLLEVMREAVAVARARNVDLPPEFAEDRLAFCDTLPPTMTSSMHQDLERGNRLELPWLSGGVSELGAHLNIPTPKNDAITDVLTLHTAGK